MGQGRKIARRHHYLMCRPIYFDVQYSINPWMNPDVPTAGDVALAQWKWLHDLFVDLGHRVSLIEPRPGLPDMVFAANGAITLDGKALVARFRHSQRTGESAAYLEWFTSRGWDVVRQAGYLNEGGGDYLVAGDRILAGSGFRTEPRAHDEVRDFFGRPVIGLTLVNPRYYHLDTALAVLDDEQIMYYPAAFAPESVEVLRHLYPDAIVARDRDAEAFGLNAVSDGRHVLLSSRATRLAAELAEHGYEPILVDTSELLKSGGSVKCCALELRGGPVE